MPRGIPNAPAPVLMPEQSETREADRQRILAETRERIAARQAQADRVRAERDFAAYDGATLDSPPDDMAPPSQSQRAVMAHRAMERVQEHWHSPSFVWVNHGGVRVAVCTTCWEVSQPRVWATCHVHPMHSADECRAWAAEQHRRQLEWEAAHPERSREAIAAQAEQARAAYNKERAERSAATRRRNRKAHASQAAPETV